MNVINSGKYFRGSVSKNSEQATSEEYVDPQLGYLIRYRKNMTLGENERLSFNTHSKDVYKRQVL